MHLYAYILQHVQVMYPAHANLKSWTCAFTGSIVTARGLDTISKRTQLVRSIMIGESGEFKSSTVPPRIYFAQGRTLFVYFLLDTHACKQIHKR